MPGRLATSFALARTALRLTWRYPPGLLVALANLVFVLAAAAGPIAGMVWLAFEDPERAMWALDHVFQFWPVHDRIDALAAGHGTVESVVTAFSLWLLFLYVVWVTAFTFGTLVASTLIMHTGAQQLRGERPSLRAAFGVVRANAWRLLGLALLAGAAMGLVRRVLSTTRVVPLIGRWIQRGVVALLALALYLALPVVVYERKGPWAAFRSCWRDVRDTWGGLAVGTGLLLGAVWVALWLVDYAVLAMLENVTGWALVDWTTILVLQILAAAALYAVNVALAANLRAALYLHVREGRTDVLPEGVLAPRPAPSVAPAPNGMVPRG